MARRMLRSEFIKEVVDDWYGNYVIPGDARFENKKYVRVSMMPLNTTPTTYRVCVWGTDDFGMDYDVRTSTEATSMFKRIAAVPLLSKDWLSNRGFVNA